MWNYGQYAFQNAYTPSNPDVDAALPTPVPEGNGFGYSYIDIWSFDASYLKLKNISLRYDLKTFGFEKSTSYSRIGFKFRCD